MSDYDIKYVSIVVLFALVCMVTALRGQEPHSGNNNSDPVSELPRHVGWKAYGNNPIIQAGDLMRKGLWNDPCVLKEDKQYVMYLTSCSTGNPTKPPVLPFRAVSEDGLKWTLEPKQALIDTAGTPFVSIETPSVVKFQDRYHLFYTGVFPKGAPAPFAIGHAVSQDGIIWKKDTAALLTATGNSSDWNGTLVGEPGAVIYKNKMYLYFTAVSQLPGKLPPLSQVIGFTSSADGVHFGEPKCVLRQSKTYLPEKTFCGYSTPAAVVHDDKIHLFYDVVIFNKDIEPNWQQVALTHAVSEDGGLSFKEDRAPFFTRKDFDWTQGEILAPSVLIEGDDVRMWFAGHVKIPDFKPMINKGIKGREFGIGYATTQIKFLYTGIKK